MMKKRSPRDYKFLRLLGEGSFSSVYLAVDADDKKLTKIRKYAIKVCQKSYIKRQGKQAAIMREKEIMNVLNQSPNEHFIRLHCTFQDVDRLYFVMSYAENGEFLTYMQEHPLNLKQVRKYTLQLVDALEHMHKLDIVHRDLKPENLLLDDQMNILITDFGSAQIYPEEQQQQQQQQQHNNSNEESSNEATATSTRRLSFVGTAQYVSPEMLKSRQASNKSDLWALGVIIYQMITNVMPFNAPNEYLIYQKIQNLDYKFPDDFDPDARDLVNSLVKIEPIDRLGAKDNLKTDGYPSIRRHQFLSSTEPNDCATNNTSADSCGEELEKNHQIIPDPDLANVDKTNPGLDEAQLLRLLTVG